MSDLLLTEEQRLSMRDFATGKCLPNFKPLTEAQFDRAWGDLTSRGEKCSRQDWIDAAKAAMA